MTRCLELERPCAVPRFAVVRPAAGDVLSAIAALTRLRDMAPTIRELAAYLGWTSTGHVAEHLARLRLLRLVRWRQRAHRSLVLTGAPWVVVADKPSVIERCRFCGEPVYECDGFKCGGKTVRR